MTRRAARLTLALVLCTIVTPPPALAAQGCGINGLLQILDPITRSLVSGLLQLSCTANADANAFGNINPLGATALHTNGNIRVDCSFSLLGSNLGLPPILVCYDVSLSAGTGAYAQREMASGGNRLAYNLFTTPTYTTIWGDGTGGSSKVSDSYLLPLGSTTRSYTTYGQVPLPQSVAAGSYVDTVIVTIDY